MPVRTPRGAPGPGEGQPPPGRDRSQELLDACNAIAYGLSSLAEQTSRLNDNVEALQSMVEHVAVVSQQFSVLIAIEADKRNVTAEKLVEQTLLNLGNRVFGKRR